MDSREKKKLKRQLETQALAFEKQSDSAAALSAVATCRALLKFAEEVSPAQFTKTEFEDIYAGYLSLAKYIEQFNHRAKIRADKDEPQGKQSMVFDSLKLEIADANAHRMSLESAEREMASVREMNEKLEREISECQSKIQSEKRKYDSLINTRAAVSAKLDIQKKSNEEMHSFLEEQKLILEDEKSRESELLAESARIQNDIDKTQSSIDAIPKENSILLGQFKEKKSMLEQLERAKVDCSPEVQASLQNKIDELVPVVEELQSVCDVLSNRLADLKQRELKFDAEKQTLSENVLLLAGNAISELEKVLNSHEETLTAVKTTADTLSKKTKDCLQMRDSYRDWFDVQETPLEAMIRALDLPESIKLRETLDVGTLKRVRELMEEVKNGLGELDGILGACSIAVRDDHREILSRTHI